MTSPQHAKFISKKWDGRLRRRDLLGNMLLDSFKALKIETVETAGSPVHRLMYWLL
jgi:hypothetical protein